MQNKNINNFHIPDNEDMIYSVCTDLKTGIIISRQLGDISIYETIFTTPTRNLIFGEIFGQASAAVKYKEDYDKLIFNIYEKMGYLNIPLNAKWKDISTSNKRGIAKMWNWVNSL